MKGKVILHLSDFVLKDVTFKVSEAGRQRVIREKRKNVHAGVVGNLIDECIMSDAVSVTYNPYKNSTFVKVDGDRIDSSDYCFSIGKKIFAVL